MPSRDLLERSPEAQALTDADFQLSDAQFDPIAFLNDELPAPSFSTQIMGTKINRASQIQTVSSATQALLSKLNTHNNRSSSELTALTDEILRSGNRLAYEVEILRGDVNNLHDLLTETLRDDIRQFVIHDAVWGMLDGAMPHQKEDVPGSNNCMADPEFITQLRMLGIAKARLETVVAVFGEAMKWPLPPSELSMANSLISVSSPEFGVHSTEEDDRARKIARAFRGEVADLLDSAGGGYAGLETATKRVGEFRQLAGIWKGTAEEKPRSRFVDSLAKIIEDRRKALDAKGGPRQARSDTAQRSGSSQERAVRDEAGPASGLLRNLARLKDDLYLE